MPILNNARGQIHVIYYLLVDLLLKGELLDRFAKPCNGLAVFFGILGKFGFCVCCGREAARHATHSRTLRGESGKRRKRCSLLEALQIG